MSFGREAPEFQVKNRLYLGGGLRSQAALTASGLKPDDAVQDLIDVFRYRLARWASRLTQIPSICIALRG